jgi:hypothetical protein
MWLKKVHLGDWVGLERGKIEIGIGDRVGGRIWPQSLFGHHRGGTTLRRRYKFPGTPTHRSGENHSSQFSSRAKWESETRKDREGKVGLQGLGGRDRRRASAQDVAAVWRAWEPPYVAMSEILALALYDPPDVVVRGGRVASGRDRALSGPLGRGGGRDRSAESGISQSESILRRGAGFFLATCLRWMYVGFVVRGSVRSSLSFSNGCQSQMHGMSTCATGRT